MGSLLLMTLDAFALNSVNSSTVRISTDNIGIIYKHWLPHVVSVVMPGWVCSFYTCDAVLNVQEVLEPVEPVVGIEVEETNRIVLPTDLFTTNRSGRFLDQS